MAGRSEFWSAGKDVVFYSKLRDKAAAVAEGTNFIGNRHVILYIYTDSLSKEFLNCYCRYSATRESTIEDARGLERIRDDAIMFLADAGVSSGLLRRTSKDVCGALYSLCQGGGVGWKVGLLESANRCSRADGSRPDVSLVDPTQEVRVGFSAAPRPNDTCHGSPLGVKRGAAMFLTAWSSRLGAPQWVRPRSHTSIPPRVPSLYKAAFPIFWLVQRPTLLSCPLT